MSTHEGPGHSRGAASAVAAADACPCKTSRFIANIWTAAHYGDAVRLAHLLAPPHSKSPSVPDECGHTPLHYASGGGHSECVALLLRAGAAVNAAGCGALPLHRAAYGGHAGVVSQLLAAGSQLNVPDAATGDGRTPLAKAAANGHAAVVGLLLAAGADPAAVDARGAVAWQLVAANGGGAYDAGTASAESFLAALPTELQSVAALPPSERHRLLLGAGGVSPQTLLAVLAVAAGAPPDGVIDHFRRRLQQSQLRQSELLAAAVQLAPAPPASPAASASFCVACPHCGALAFALQRAPVSAAAAPEGGNVGDSLVCKRCASAMVAQARRAVRAS